MIKNSGTGFPDFRLLFQLQISFLQKLNRGFVFPAQMLSRGGLLALTLRQMLPLTCYFILQVSLFRFRIYGILFQYIQLSASCLSLTECLHGLILGFLQVPGDFFRDIRINIPAFRQFLRQIFL